MLSEKIDAQGQQLNEKIDSLNHRLTSLEVSNSHEHRLILQMIKELSEKQQQLKRAK